MKVYFDGQWVLERDDGSVIRLAWNESSLLRSKMQRALLWEEVAERFEEHPQWKEICESQEDILDDLCEFMEPDDTTISDNVWEAVNRWVDLEDEDADMCEY